MNGPSAGTILVDALEGETVVSGTLAAKGTERTGGNIDVFGETVVVSPSGLVDASGESGGGNIRLGGSFQGRDTAVHHAQATHLEAGARVQADALESGAGGEIIVWSEQITLVDGYVFARGIGRWLGRFRRNLLTRLFQCHHGARDRWWHVAHRPGRHPHLQLWSIVRSELHRFRGCRHHQRG